MNISAKLKVSDTKSATTPSRKPLAVIVTTEQTIHDIIMVNRKMIIDIEFGGVSKRKLLKELISSGILLNQYAEMIFSNKDFRCSKKRQKISLVTTNVEKLGFSDGATMMQIKQALKSFGLSECPIEVAPYLRLHLKKQREIKKETKNKAPFGSLTIFSKPLVKDDDFPKGFYLRKYQGNLWLRGYCCSLDHKFNSKDKFIFKLSNSK